MKFKYIKVVIAALFLGIFQNLFLKDYTITIDLLSNFIVFLSIVFGFYVTSLAIFSTSDYSKILYKKIDSNNKSLTLLHVLLRKYKRGLVLILISIFYLLFLDFLVTQNGSSKLNLEEPILWPFLAIIVVNFAVSLTLIKDLIAVIIKEGGIR